MRLAAIDTIDTNTLLGRNIYSGDGTMLLRQGIALKSEYLNRMKQLGYYGVFVDDSVSYDVDVPDVIPEDLRRESVNIIKNLYAAGQNHSRNVEILCHKTKKLVDDIMDEVLSNRKDVLDLRDIKTLDEYLFQHSVNVAVLALSIGRAYGLLPDVLRELGLAAILHDAGMMNVSEKIQKKPGKLTEQEYAEIRGHSVGGFELMKYALRTSAVSYVSVLQHHERFDKSGYPNQKGGDGITILARILALADTYDAMTSARSYRPHHSPSEAYEYISANSGAAFDPQLVSIFSRRIAPFAAGSTVELSDGRLALVVENNSNFILRPIIRIIDGNEDNFTMLDLSKEALNITISDMV